MMLNLSWVIILKKNSNCQVIGDFQEDLDSIDEEISNLENVIKNPELLDVKEEETDVGDERDKNLEFKRRKAKTREWDKPKLSN